MAQCSKCREQIVNTQEIIICVECKSSFHLSCTKTKRSETSKKSLWKCESCRTETLSSTSRASDSDSVDKMSANILKCIEDLRQDLYQQFNVVNANVGKVESELAGVKNSIETINTAMKDLQNENESRAKEYEYLKNENTTLKKEAAELKDELHELQQHSRRDNIEIRGVPSTQNEDVYLVLERIAKLISIPFNRWEISVAHRLPESRRGYHPAIVVRFISRTAKEAWMSAARSCKLLTAAELSDNWQSTRIFLNDHLTARNKGLLGHAKELQRAKKLAYVWTKNCRVLVRKTADGPVKIIKSSKDIEEVLRE